uniref:Uncharacterized protein n=1 Tax=Candidatus Methanogaster sp. ANME-2c ERB4 TaxID=2759911 RepID=A0A7G9YRN0_9EURY|nr:hypothetical protein CAOPPJJI_00019 [Methanosarcinales archaeon ANME-2c ERB4]QNO43280.1 hypothetical protein EGFCMMFL_00002 [Methanosarcinales archaeon ANME-2c ERB4]QNO45754.1 hypothetical protein FHBEAHMJ_00004 [Methanosarcinales archaeon ANME-2c ERB4]QNO49725.1 hypothetical protein BFOKDAJI_00027 [Methanosarcinales archaeon ANME-2c ERB4]QNO49753.1 hypothetical protein BFOKDAJI_00056 [Methanosarcinales archaeon ANME-2c ERB4]
MRFVLKLAVLVTVSLLLISAGAFVYPLMQDPFERQYMDVDAGNVTELEGGFHLEYDLPDSPYELAGASLFVHSANKTVAAHYLHDGKRERLSSGEPFETVVVSGNLSDPEERGTGWCYLFDATDAVRDSRGAGRVVFMVEMNKSALLRPYTGNERAEKSYPDMSLTYWKPSTSSCAGLAAVFIMLFILSAIGTGIYAVVTRGPAKREEGEDGGSNENEDRN